MIELGTFSASSVIVVGAEKEGRRSVYLRDDNQKEIEFSLPVNEATLLGQLLDGTHELCKSTYQELQAAYEELVKQSANRLGTIPHCDSLVLHDIGECAYCDKRSELQMFRIDNDIDFTGKRERKFPCFAETRRKLSDIEEWTGNRKSGDD